MKKKADVDTFVAHLDTNQVASKLTLLVPFSSVDSLLSKRHLAFSSSLSETNREPMTFQLTRCHAFCPGPVISVSYIYGLHVFSVLCYLLLCFLPVFLLSSCPPQACSPLQTCTASASLAQPIQSLFQSISSHPADTDNSLKLHYVDLLQFWH